MNYIKVTWSVTFTLHIVLHGPLLFQVGERQANCHAEDVYFFLLEPFGSGGGVRGLASVESFLRSWPHPAPN